MVREPATGCLPPRPAPRWRWSPNPGPARRGDRTRTFWDLGPRRPRSRAAGGRAVLLNSYLHRVPKRAHGCLRSPPSARGPPGGRTAQGCVPVRAHLLRLLSQRCPSACRAHESRLFFLKSSRLTVVPSLGLLPGFGVGGRGDEGGRRVPAAAPRRSFSSVRFPWFAPLDSHGLDFWPDSDLLRQLCRIILLTL